MDLPKLQIIALVVLTTILTDKFLVSNSNKVIDKNQTPTNTISSSQVENQIASSSAVIASNINSQNEIILKELINLRKDMSVTLNDIKKQATDSSSLTSTLSPSLLTGMVKINSPQWKRVDVYEKASTSSKIVNSIVYDVIYFYRQKQGDWYQIDLDLGQTGWVQSQFLKEFP